GGGVLEVPDVLPGHERAFGDRQDLRVEEVVEHPHLRPRVRHGMRERRLDHGDNDGQACHDREPGEPLHGATLPDSTELTQRQSITTTSTISAMPLRYTVPASTIGKPTA